MKYQVGQCFSFNRPLNGYLSRKERYSFFLSSGCRLPSPASIVGVSLLELLVSLSIAAILIAVSAPSMKTLIVNNRVANVTEEVYGSLMLARSEAIKRQRTVSLCSTIDAATCDEDNSGWHHGWLIFTDESNDGVLNGRDQLIRRVATQSEQVSITWNRGYNIRFNSRGQTSQAGTFNMCDQTDSDNASKNIVISMTGRLRTEVQATCG